MSAPLAGVARGVRGVASCGRLPALALLALLALLASGCASLVAPAPGPGASAVLPDWPTRRARLQQVSGFDLKGRIAVAAGDDGFTAGLRWRQRDAEAWIELDGPLGIGGMRLRASGEAIEVQTARGERLDGDAARAEMERRLGFELPLAALRYWVRGVPDPGVEATETLAPDAPRLAALEQRGWRVDYPAYVQVPSAGELPRRLSAVRDATRLRLVIESWSTEAPL